MNRKKWYYSISMLCCLASVSAQETNDLKKFPAQISIVYPVGTHGRQSVNHTYNLSLNLLTGKVGGVKGLEVSGLYGRVENNVLGIQIAGLGSVAGGKAKGLQASGLVNVVGDEMKGIQVSGITNVVGDGMKGVQVSGFANVIGDEMKGIQMTGFANVIGDNMKGIQVSGFANVVGDEMKGIQTSGFANVIGDDMKGIQVSGFANVVGDNMRGIQVSGFANVVGDYMKGLQIAGICNAVESVNGIQIAGIYNRGLKKDGERQLVSVVNGVQIAGIYNRTHTLRGLQIGLVSVTDTIEKGFSLSLVNIVKRGFYREWELSFSDYANVALSYKMGMQNFYTIYTAGVNFIEDNLWIVGAGFGNRTPIGNRFDFQPELVFYNYYPTNFKNIQNTFATRLKFGFVYRLNERYGLSLAPSVYVMTAQKDSDPNSKFYKVSPVSALYTNKSGNRQTTIGVGISLGLNIK